MNMIYLDNASTTQVHPKVLFTISAFLAERYGNPSSSHGFGQQAKDALETARERVAGLLKAKSSEIVFTSSGSEAINTGIKGIFWEQQKLGKTHIITSHLEHSATLQTIAWLQANHRAEVSYVHHDEKGKLDLDDLRKKIDPSKTALISIMHANNELGNINPVKEISQIAGDVPFHCDAVQTAGKIDVDVKEMGASAVSISGHKFHAPKGIGVLYMKAGLPMQSLVHGGSHERGRRAGTENVAFCAAVAEALKLAAEDGVGAYVEDVSRRFFAQLDASGVPYAINGNLDSKLNQVWSVTFPSITPKAANVFIASCDQAGVMVSNSSACSSGMEKLSHVLTAINLEKEVIRKTARISFSKFNTMEEVDTAAEKIASVVKDLS